MTTHPLILAFRTAAPRQTPEGIAKVIAKRAPKIILGAFALSALVMASNCPPAIAQATYPILAEGSSGESVSQLQATLQLLGFYLEPVNGTYTPATVEAVAQFQLAAGISADGIAGPSTWQTLLPQPGDVTAVAAPAAPQPVRAETTPQPPVPDQPPLGPPVLRVEAAGPAVSQLQRELQELGYYNGPIDGGFGAETLAAVERFQSDKQLFVDGVVGQSTWDALSEELD